MIVDVSLNTLMAQRKTEQLEGGNKRSVAQKARRAKELRSISELADANLAVADAWRVIRPEHLEAIKLRLVAGDTLGNICRELGIERGVVCQYVYEHPEFAQEYLAFKEFGTHAMWDRLLEMIPDTTMSSADKMFAYKVINSYTSKINRTTYADGLRVDQNVAVSVSMSQWGLGGPVIDGNVIEDPDQDD